jgi:dTDP-4-dehydrorhamnose 3,5-epimerase
MLENSRRDPQTVTPDGTRVATLIEGVKVRYAVTHVDERGTLTEVYNPAWGFHDDPMVYLYQFTIRPGQVKGWIVHEEQDDRLFLSFGAVKIVLYDSRPESSTYRLINEIFLSDHNRGLVLFPHGVYHAVQNIGHTDLLMMNSPTRPYNHENPDKYRLPLVNDVIPYSFK